jgi:hypothetical protein
VRPSLLILTNWQNGCADEELLLADFLRQWFAVSVTHYKDAAALEDVIPSIVVRNTWPTWKERDDYVRTQERWRRKRCKVYNSLDGRGDLRGKQYLVDLTLEGYPVIPTVDHTDGMERFGNIESWIVKTMLGCSSDCIRRVRRIDICQKEWEGHLIQPFIDFAYEVSWYFVDSEFAYALFAPNPESRWSLKLYESSEEDLRFASEFVRWNTLSCGIQRIDACRTQDGQLLLMEIEDHNPYLSLDVLPLARRNIVLERIGFSIRSHFRQ